MTNKRKGKNLYSIWLTDAEYESIIESLKLIREETPLMERGMENICEIIDNSYFREDFIKV